MRRIIRRHVKFPRARHLVCSGHVWNLMTTPCHLLVFVYVWGSLQHAPPHHSFSFFPTRLQHTGPHSFSVSEEAILMTILTTIAQIVSDQLAGENTESPARLRPGQKRKKPDAWPACNLTALSMLF